MLQDETESAQESEGKLLDKTLLVKRSKLMFNDKECIVLTFQDISTIKKLKHEEQKSRLMSTLYSSVNHEIIGPLKSNEQAALRLIRGIQDQSLREQAQIILVCSKQAILNANDLLDKKLL